MVDIHLCLFFLLREKNKNEPKDGPEDEPKDKQRLNEIEHLIKKRFERTIQSLVSEIEAVQQKYGLDKEEKAECFQREKHTIEASPHHQRK